MHLRAVDPQHNKKMIGIEKTFRQRFERLKHPAQSSPLWKKDFKNYVDQVIKQCFNEKEVITLTPFIDRKDEEDALTVRRAKMRVKGISFFPSPHFFFPMFYFFFLCLFLM